MVDDGDGRGGDEIFPDYNLAPYSGGYDQALTYGQPLSPSHRTCYSPQATGEVFSDGDSQPNLLPQGEWGSPHNPGLNHPLFPPMSFDGLSSSDDNGNAWFQPSERYGLYLPRDSSGIEFQEAGINNYDNGIGYDLHPFSGWFASFEDKDLGDSGFSGIKDYRDQQDHRSDEYPSESMSAFEYIFGTQHQVGQRTYDQGVGND